ncbi:Oxysterol-binding protein [Nadsonia fulvescens var. elongata DSM 6958]|uniref:Oxysterol-binding protein n=1 Tax=Nadsonia fulvescens var. elongata DSM 6958 TaxID=857566 RepID=A0A1E3PHY1_9ASCO|nr:Oxysterol-binding protein [Nadsonia fulvescens var. elongata DSM 6958]
MPHLLSSIGILGKSSPTPSEPEDVDVVDDEGQGILMGIISQLRPGSDLTRITLPTFILEPKSMLERITNQLQHPEILLEAREKTNEVERFVDIVRWALSGWHITPKAVKKPLNPILGEYFTCYWDLPNKTQAYYIAEQTSHHPPKSSYFYASPDNHIRVDGLLVPKSRFLGNSAASLLEGVAQLKFEDIKNAKGEVETYNITQPNMYVRGILFGRLKFELCEHSIITCANNDLICDVDFKAKGFISGSYNAIEGTIKRISTGEVLYEISGHWNEVIEIKDAKTKKKWVLFDALKSTPSAPQVRPLEEQGEFESRKLWHKVNQALIAKNQTVATDEKSIIEGQQRSDARKREEDNVEFHPKLFRQVNSPTEFLIYKDLDPSRHSPECQKEIIFSIAPISPGQKFSKDFEIPGYKKLEKEHAVRDLQPASDPLSFNPLNNVEDLKESLPVIEDTI